MHLQWFKIANKIGYIFFQDLFTTGKREKWVCVLLLALIIVTDTYAGILAEDQNKLIIIFLFFHPTQLWVSWCRHSCWIQFVCLLQECVDQYKSNFLIPIRFYLFFSSRFTLQQFYLWVFNLKPKAKFADLLLAEEGCTYFWKYTVAAAPAFFLSLNRKCLRYSHY